MTSFVHAWWPGRVVFGPGAVARVAEECSRLGPRHTLVIAGGSAAAAGDRVAAELGAGAASRWARVAPYVPEALVAETTAAARARGTELLCCLGGGSATGLAKAVAVALDLPIVAVPTTYAGSEATHIYGITGEQRRVRRDPRALPRVVVYDPALTTGLPARVTATSGGNALAHVVAVLCGAGSDPFALLHAEEGLRLLARHLPTAVASPSDLDARGALLVGAHLAGRALAAAGGGLHHRLCHLIGGRHPLVHAGLHAVLLPYTVAWDPALSAGGRARVAALLDAPDAAEGLWRLTRDLGVPAGLGAIGLEAGVLDGLASAAAAELGAGDARWFRGLLDAAYRGDPPAETPADPRRQKGTPP